MAALEATPHIKLYIDADGQLYLLDQNTREKKLIPMRKNSDGSRTSRANAGEIEDLIWDFRYDHKDTKKGDAPIEASATTEESS